MGTWKTLEAKRNETNQEREKEEKRGTNEKRKNEEQKTKKEKEILKLCETSSLNVIACILLVFNYTDSISTNIREVLNMWLT